MRKIKIVIILIIILYVIYILISRNSLVDYTSKRIEIQDVPKPVQNWIYNIKEEDTHLCKIKENSKMKFYMYVPVIKIVNEYKSYETINIKPIAREGIEIIIDYKINQKNDSLNPILIELIIIEPKIKYIKLSDAIIDVNDISDVSSWN